MLFKRYRNIVFLISRSTDLPTLLELFHRQQGWCGIVALQAVSFTSADSSSGRPKKRQKICCTAAQKSIADLPDDVLASILDLCGKRDHRERRENLRSYRLVCQKWNSVLRSKLVILRAFLLLPQDGRKRYLRRQFYKTVKDVSLWQPRLDVVWLNMVVEIVIRDEMIRFGSHVSVICSFDHSHLLILLTER